MGFPAANPAHQGKQPSGSDLRAAVFRLLYNPR
jgi:hypothetical protein